MKICRISDDYRPNLGAVGYLFYYENADRFYIEIPSELSSDNAPMILDHEIEYGRDYVDAEWSKKWVCNRIVPRDRQNLGHVLRDSGLEEYNEYKLLLFGDGRCAQDDCYIEPITEEQLPDEIKERKKQRIYSVTALNEQRILVYFYDGKGVVCDVRALVGKEQRFKLILEKESLFESVKVNAGGYSIGWGTTHEIPDYVLRNEKKEVPISLEDMRLFIEHETCDTAETTRRLNCTRQNIDDLVRRGRLTPVKTGARSKLFFCSEVEERLW
jgi:hypothetical protein